VAGFGQQAFISDEDAGGVREALDEEDGVSMTLGPAVAEAVEGEGEGVGFRG
jgi:hypothetical protein